MVNQKSKRIIAADGTKEDDKGIQQIPPEAVKLGNDLKTLFSTSHSHYASQCIRKRMADSLQHVRGCYTEEELTKIQEFDEPDLFLPIPGLNARAMEAWLRDSVANTREKDWLLEPSALPELSEEAKDRIKEDLTKEIMDSDLSLSVDEITAHLEEAVLKEQGALQAEAKRANDFMEMEILDQLQHGGWDKARSEALTDITTFQIVVIQGPIVRHKKSLKWVDNEPKVVMEPQLTVERIPPYSIIPTPDMTDPQNGTGLFKEFYMTKNDLVVAYSLGLKADDGQTNGYLPNNIRYIIENFHDGHEISELSSMDIDKLLGKDYMRGAQTDKDKEGSQGNFHTLAYYGSWANSQLIELGVIKKDGKEGNPDTDPYATSEVELWMIDNVPIYAQLNPDPLGRRPFSIMPIRPRAGSFFGDMSFPEIARPVTRILNGLTRYMILNAGFIAGPVGEVESTRFINKNPPSMVKPRTVYATTPSVNGQPAVRLTSMESHMERFINAIRYFREMAGDLTGVPAFIYGNPDASGAAATLGGMNMLFDQASKGVKMTLDNFDEFIIVPTIERFVDYNLLFNEKAYIKGDVRVRSLGLYGILQKERQQGLLANGLQQLLGYFQLIPDYADQNTIIKVLSPVLEGFGIDTNDIFNNPNRQEDLANAFSSGDNPLQVGTPPPSVEPRTPGPVIDNRSIPASDRT